MHERFKQQVGGAPELFAYNSGLERRYTDKVKIVLIIVVVFEITTNMTS